jgi:DNA-binding MarR family transcriptional regulator
MDNKQIESVLIALRRVIRATDLHSRELVRTSGLTAPQLLLLQTISNRHKITGGMLAQEMRLSQATVTNIVDRLEKRGMVRREKDPVDKRRINVLLTDKGHHMLEGAPAPLQDRFVQSFRQLADWEQHMIISALQRVATMMDAEALDASPMLDIGKLDRSEPGPASQD